MKVQLYDKPTAGVLRLKAINYDSGVCLVAVDADGEQLENGFIVSVEEDGIHQYACVNPECGLPLEADGSVVVATAYEEVLKLLKPFAEYAATISREYADETLWNSHAGKLITTGEFRALADFYERHK